MALGGSPIFVFSGPDGRNKNYVVVDGLTMGGNMGPGAFDPSRADSGVLTTAVPGPNETPLPAAFGRGRDLWRAGDENYVRNDLVVEWDGSGTVAVPLIAVGYPLISNGNLYIGFVNPLSANLVRFRIQYVHSLIR